MLLFVLAPFKTLGTLLLLLIALPFNAAVVLLALLWSRLTRSPSRSLEHSKTILLTGGKMTKALQLARSFHAAGHRVILAETQKYWLTGHRFSRSVDRFYTISSPTSEGYTEALLAIAKSENVDVYVPVCSPVASYYDSLAKPLLAGCCEVFHFDADVTVMLDDKFAFAEQA
ncbi:MAG: ATP-grasp enzyme, partial [Phormidesmis sp. CAN_BIN36]|nr:ATP-grasp enzyme [Phormidesmis sp. CAN_BIN36]